MLLWTVKEAFIQMRNRSSEITAVPVLYLVWDMGEEEKEACREDQIDSYGDDRGIIEEPIISIIEGLREDIMDTCQRCKDDGDRQKRGIKLEFSL